VLTSESYCQNWSTRIRGTFGALIKSYLTERYQRVAIRDKTNTINYSNWELVRLGVPEGSILSPLLFIIPVYK
jgi:hypothetical protein